jgi:hypothetical protein
VILAHFTSNDSSSFALVVGLALLVLGIRGAFRTRNRRVLTQLVAGALLLAGGVALGWVH